ncbi:MAG: hypothetical protein HQK77_04870 [Desulfobacterales bacterium]|nr:hypothetical protein [Desulfobacterales bacterium]
MKWKVQYTKQSLKFFKKSSISIESIDHLIQEAIKSVIHHENTNINIVKMKGEWKNFYRIRNDGLRIILKFKHEEHIVLIHRIGWRGDVYK